MKKKEDSKEFVLKNVQKVLFEEAKAASYKPIPMTKMVKELSVEPGYTKKNDVIDAIRTLEAKGEISIQNNHANSVSRLSYLLSHESNWFWAALIATLVSIVLEAATSGAALYLRYLFGALLILFLPGFAIIQLLYARQDQQRNHNESLQVTLVIVLSVAISLVVVPSVALVLNYTPLGITLAPLSLILTAITLVCLFAGLERKFQQRKLQFQIERPLADMERT